jgi:hypothetical protein
MKKYKNIYKLKKNTKRQAFTRGRTFCYPFTSARGEDYQQQYHELTITPKS